MADTLAAKWRAKYPGAYDDLSDADLEAKVLAKYPEYHDLATPPPPEPSAAKPSDSGALALAAVPDARYLAEQFATSPSVPRAMAKMGRVVGGVSPIVGGYEAAGVPGALMGVGASAKGSWAGGKAGWFTGKLAQNMATPVARALGRIAPTAYRLSGAQGVNDLAQMADPKREDIGFLGVGPSTPHDADHPAALNALIEAIRRRLRGE